MSWYKGTRVPNCTWLLFSAFCRVAARVAVVVVGLPQTSRHFCCVLFSVCLQPCVSVCVNGVQGTQEFGVSLQHKWCYTGRKIEFLVEGVRMSG
jgi:hypothetical protein